jgi:S-adenosylmethionine hydrolase
MKGVLLERCPGATVVDISHEVPPHDVAHGAFVLDFASRHFPPEAVHVAVVDPGVGSDRRPLLLVTPDGAFVGPDNGLLGYVFERYSEGRDFEPGEPVAPGTPQLFEPVTASVPDACQAFVLDNPKFWREPVSDTFHGRDVFAPVAGHLASGVKPGCLGAPVDEVVTLWVPRPVRRGALVHGTVVYVDRFGNLVSNVRPADFGAVEYVEVQGTRIEGLGHSYRDSPGPLALVGSHGYVEIAFPEGSAADQIGAKVGTEIVLGVRGGPKRA